MVKERIMSGSITEKYLIESAVADIDQYLGSERFFPDLVSRLDAYISQVGATSGRDIRFFRDTWIKLEIINAIALADSDCSPRQRDMVEVRDLLIKMKKDLEGIL